MVQTRNTSRVQGHKCATNLYPTIDSSTLTQSTQTPTTALRRSSHASHAFCLASAQLAAPWLEYPHCRSVFCRPHRLLIRTHSRLLPSPDIIFNIILAPLLHFYCEQNPLHPRHSYNIIGPTRQNLAPHILGSHLVRVLVHLFIDLYVFSSFGPRSQ